MSLIISTISIIKLKTISVKQKHTPGASCKVNYGTSNRFQKILVLTITRCNILLLNQIGMPVK